MMNRDIQSEKVSIVTQIDDCEVTLIIPLEQEDDILENAKELLIRGYTNNALKKGEER